MLLFSRASTNNGACGAIRCSGESKHSRWKFGEKASERSSRKLRTCRLISRTTALAVFCLIEENRSSLWLSAKLKLYLRTLVVGCKYDESSCVWNVRWIPYIISPYGWCRSFFISMDNMEVYNGLFIIAPEIDLKRLHLKSLLNKETKYVLVPMHMHKKKCICIEDIHKRDCNNLVDFIQSCIQLKDCRDYSSCTESPLHISHSFIYQRVYVCGVGVFITT